VRAERTQPDIVDASLLYPGGKLTFGKARAPRLRPVADIDQGFNAGCFQRRNDIGEPSLFVANSVECALNHYPTR
jgi:hypothetical protein